MAVQNSLVKQNQKQTFSAFLAQDAMKKKINEMVGGEKGQQFITAIISAVSTNPGLAECDHSSIVSAALLGQSLNLTPSPQLGQYYLVPFNDKKRGCKVAQFQLGYKGYIQLAIRSGYYKKINVIALKEGELIKYDPLAEEIEVNLIEDDEVREEAETVGYYAMFEYQNGFRKTIYWSKKKMLSHANKYSQAFNAESYKKLQEGKIPENDLWKYSSFWYKDFDGMAYKTMLRQLISKWGIMSIEMQEAYAKDMATIKENGEYEYVENIETTYEEQPTIVTQENVETKTTEKTANKEVENVEKTTEILPNIKDEEVKNASAENEIQDTVNDTDDFFDN
ncbi:MAG: recombinase RecT [Clostridia bacterium]|nr:recombinase RecT [Clostridia bacterium]